MRIFDIQVLNGQALIFIKESRYTSAIVSWHFESNTVQKTEIAGLVLLTCWRTYEDSARSIVILALDSRNDIGPLQKSIIRVEFAIAHHIISCLSGYSIGIVEGNDLTAGIYSTLLTVARYKQCLFRHGTYVSQMLPSKCERTGRLYARTCISYNAKNDELRIRNLTYDLDYYPYSTSKMLSVDGIMYTMHQGMITIYNPFNDFGNLNMFETGEQCKPIDDEFIVFGDHRIFGAARPCCIRVWSFDPYLRLGPNARGRRTLL